MLEQLRAQLRDLLARRATHQSDLDAVLETPTTEGRSLTEDESTRFAELRDALTSIDEERAAVQTQIAELEQLDAARSAAEAITVPAAPATEGRSEGTEVRVGAEAPLYRADGEHDFLVDIYAADRNGDSGAAQRIARHNEVALREARATTTAWVGAVVPQYLLDMFAPKLRSGRPFLNVVRNLDLPATGMVLNIPKVTTGSTVAAQSDENTSVSNTTMATTNMTVDVNTYAGQQVVSRQAVKRGQGVSELIVADLFGDYATKTNVAALAGAGTNGTHLGVLSSTLLTTVAYTGTTAVALISKIAGATSGIHATLFGSPDLIVMHPRRWAHIITATDSNGRPLAGVEAGQTNVLASGDAALTGQIVGTIHGIPVLTDAGVPTNLNGTWATDAVVVTKREEVLFWEEPGAPMSVQLEEVLRDQLSIRFVLEGASAFTAERRTEATQIITGTGLVAPTF
jgi:HK97 family phage major capsid protein